MGQRRLNSLAVAHVQKVRVRDVSVDGLMTELIGKADSRKNTFGS